jgi:hypothetical protein
MRMTSLLACITVIAGTICTGSALAQSAPGLNSPDIVGGSFGSMTCADFTSMSHAQQASLTRDAKSDAAPMSLTSNSGTGNSSAASGRGNSNDGSGANAGVGLGAPLNSGQLIAACEAAPVSATLQDAYSSFISGSSNANGNDNGSSNGSSGNNGGNTIRGR